jgi:biopolymer transport protein ExbD
MIDLVFLLLIFFLICARWRPQEDFLPLQFASASTMQSISVKPEPLVFSISALNQGCSVKIGLTDSIRVADKTIKQDLIELTEKTKSTLLKQKRTISDPVEIHCDSDVKWDYVAKIYNVLCGMGLTDITFTMTE